MCRAAFPARWLSRAQVPNRPLVLHEDAEDAATFFASGELECGHCAARGMNLEADITNAHGATVVVRMRAFYFSIFVSKAAGEIVLGWKGILDIERDLSPRCLWTLGMGARRVPWVGLP